MRNFFYSTLKSTLLIALILFHFSSWSAVIQSTATGGLWTNTATWVGGVVPGPGDDVFINGTVEVTSNSCLTLTVNPGGVLQGQSGGTRTLSVVNVVTNQGTIRNNPNGWLLNLNVGGNLVNHGTFTNSEVRVTGSGQRSISGSLPFTISWLTYDNSAVSLSLASNVSMNGTRVQLAGGQLTIPTGYELFLYGANGYIDNGAVAGNGSGSVLRMTGQTYVASVGFNNLDFDSIIQVANNCTFNGNIRNYGVLQSLSGGNRTAQASGYFFNYGTIRNNPNGWVLNLHFVGTPNYIYNNGTWVNNLVFLQGNGQHNLYAGPGNDYGPASLESDSLASIVMHTDITLNNTSVYIPGSVWSFNSSNLTLEHFGSSKYFSGGTIIAAHGTVRQGGSNYFSSQIINNPVFEGVVQFGNNVTLTGEVVSNDTLQSLTGGTRVVSINGNLTNNGLIRNHPNGWVLQLHLAGNFIHNGSATHDLNRLNGTTDQHLTFGNGVVYSGNLFTAEKSGGSVISSSDLEFANTNINFNDSTLVMPANSTLKHSGSNRYIDNIKISGSNFTLWQTGNAYIYRSVLENVTFKGLVQAHNSVFVNNYLVVEDTLQGYTGNTRTIVINGNLTNNGLIRNHPNGWLLQLHLAGNFIHNGSAIHDLTRLNGTTDQHLTFGNGVVYSGNLFTAEKSGGSVIATTDLTFVTTNINFNDSTLVMPANSTLKHSGSNRYIDNIKISGSNFTLWQTGNAYIYRSVLENVTFKGLVQIHNNVVVNNHLVVADTVQGYSTSTRTLIVDGNLTNNGWIRNNASGYWFQVNLSGDFTNNGQATHQLTLLNGAGNQNLAFGNGVVYSGNLFNAQKSGGSVFSTTDLTFSNTNLNFSDSTLVMASNSTLTHSGSGRYIENIKITGSHFNLFQTGNAYLFRSVLENVTFMGVVQVNNNVVVNNSLVVEGTLQGHGTATRMLMVDGNLTNKGLIRNNPSGYLLNLEVSGNFANGGQCTNNQIEINGTMGQYVYLLNGTPINTNLRLNSNIGGSSYVWYKDGGGSSVASGAIYTINPVNSTHYGSYRCISTSDTSRNIIIAEQFLCIEPTNPFTSRVAPTTARLNWTTSSNAAGYLIRGRGVGFPNWTYVVVTGGSTNFVNVSGLFNNTNLEWQIASLCNGGADTSAWSQMVYFTTGCYPPDSLWNATVTHNAASFNWNRGWGTYGYEIRGRVFGFTGGTNVLVGGGTTTSKNIFGLNPNTTYEWRIRSACNPTGTYVSAWSPWITFTTTSGARLTNVQDPFNENEAAEPMLLIYPNPMESFTRLVFDNPNSRPYLLIVRDVNGREVFRDNNISGSSYELTRSNFQSGLYFIELWGENVYRGKVLVP